MKPSLRQQPAEPAPALPGFALIDDAATPSPPAETLAAAGPADPSLPVAQRAVTQLAPGGDGQPTPQPPSIDVDRTTSRTGLWRRRRNTVIAAVVLLAVAAIGITACSVTPPSPHATTPTTASTGPTTPSTGSTPTPASRQTVLPFTGLNSPFGVAVDSAGSVYVADARNHRVLKFAAGSNTQTVLPITGLHEPDSVAVDTAGDVYVLDLAAEGNRLVKLAAGSNTQTALPLSGVLLPEAVAVDSAGDVYVVDGAGGTALTHGACCAMPHVVKLAAGSSTPTVLPFTGVTGPFDFDPSDLAVDTAGSVYVTDSFNNRVLKLTAGSSTPTVLPFTGLKDPKGVAVDTAGTVYVGDNGNNRVLKLAAG